MIFASETTQLSAVVVLPRHPVAPRGATASLSRRRHGVGTAATAAGARERLAGGADGLVAMILPLESQGETLVK